jgi:hypothetical protein
VKGVLSRRAAEAEAVDDQAEDEPDTEKDNTAVETLFSSLAHAREALSEWKEITTTSGHIR